MPENGTTLSVVRLDKIHPLISGNKIFKLRLYLEEAIALGKTTIETFGGAWSNHIVATAGACRLAGLSCMGLIRGEEPAIWSATLKAAAELGMQLKFIPRDTYRTLKRTGQTGSDNKYLVPEGGFGLKGALGAASILEKFNSESYTHICCAAGTGTMTAGIATAAAKEQQVMAVSALKNNLQLQEDIESLTSSKVQPPLLLHDYHFGGFAKYTPELIQFMNTFYSQNKVPSDFVYTGKLFFAISDLLQQNFFPANSRILMLHSGGLQGNSSLSKGTLIF
jgi:1-aminocyclopropane-1-carboxylate deaminase